MEYPELQRFKNTIKSLLMSYFKKVNYLITSKPLLPKTIGPSFPNRLASGPFSNLSTPLGQTAAQIPQPTQEDLTIF